MAAAQKFSVDLGSSFRIGYVSAVPDSDQQYPSRISISNVKTLSFNLLC